jgi:hypothetical protein
MPTFVYRGGRMVDKATGAPMLTEAERAAPIGCPRVIADIAPYRSPVTGEVISGRRAKRDDLARHNCIDASDLPSPTGGRLKNRAFAERRGLTHLLAEDAR